METTSKETTKTTLKKILPKKQTEPESAEMLSNYELLKLQGIPLREVVFKTKAVKSWTGSPEMAFYKQEPKLKKERMAYMWLTPGGVICEQEKGHKVIVPLGNVAHAILL